MSIMYICRQAVHYWVRGFAAILGKALYHRRSEFPEILKMDAQNGKGAPVAEEEKAPSQGLGQWLTATTGHEVVSDTTSLSDKDEAFRFLQNSPRREELLTEGQAILNDPIKYRRLLRKIDFTIIPLLALTYFLQALDKTTLEVSPSSEPEIRCQVPYILIVYRRHGHPRGHSPGRAAILLPRHVLLGRLPGTRAPHSVDGTAHLPAWPVPRGKHIT